MKGHNFVYWLIELIITRFILKRPVVLIREQINKLSLTHGLNMPMHNQNYQLPTLAQF